MDSSNGALVCQRCGRKNLGGRFAVCPHCLFRGDGDLGDLGGLELLDELGQGGMGTVFRARHKKLQRLVAVKFPHASELTPVLRARFEQEAQMLARLNHRNVVTVFDYGEDEDGCPYIVSEFIEGQTLSELERPVPWTRALEIATGLARGLAAAHEQGILHRDIKLSNAILGKDGEAKLVDFGLATSFDSVELSRGTPPPDGCRPTFSDIARTLSTIRGAGAWEDTALGTDERLTAAGAILGTPHYIAPELWLGEEATTASDVFAFGVLLHALLVGGTPVESGDWEEFVSWAQGQSELNLTALDEVTESRLARLVKRCLARDPSARPLDDKALLGFLEALAPGGRRDGGQNPYRGLRAFEARDRAVFFGRDQESHELCRLLEAERFVLVFGESGVGKSSLVRAGVLPRLAEKDWRTVSVVPGRRPLSALARGLAPLVGLEVDEWLDRAQDDVQGLAAAYGGVPATVIFVDQMEELVSATHEEAAAAETVLAAQRELGRPARGRN